MQLADSSVVNMSRSAPEALPKTHVASSGGPPRPPRKTARGLQDEPGQPASEGDSKMEMRMALTNAQMTWSELLVLNGGGRPVKREELETSLDRSILALSKLVSRVKKAKKADLKIVRDTLRSIRDYRLRFPPSNATNHELSEQAQQILDESH